MFSQTRAGFILFCVAVLMCGMAEGKRLRSFSNATGFCGSFVKWSLDFDSGNLTIGGDGEMTDPCDWDHAVENSIKNCVIEDGVQSIAHDAFSYTTMTSVVIGNDVTVIGANAFYKCDQMESVKFGNSVKEIGDHAFYYTHLLSVTIPKSVSIIADNAFAACYNLLAIHVESENMNFEEEDGVLFTKGKTTLKRYPLAKPGDSYVIPEGVESLADTSFRSALHLSSVVFPDSLKTIGSSAFEACRKLEFAAIGRNVQSDSPNLQVLSTIRTLVLSVTELYWEERLLFE